ncbi:MAG: hypothetical protein ABSF28_15125 [Terracidiphilus sp.]|jgi:hypothetical protein
MTLKMAAAKQQPCTKASRKNTTAATRKNTSKRKAPLATGKRVGRKHYDSKQQQPTPADRPEPKPGEAASSLLGAINRHVVLDCDEIVRVIIKKAKLGDMSGLRLIADLTGAKAQCNQPPQKPHRPLLNWRADELAAQPKWHEPSDPEVDTGFGGREPEN